MAKAGKTEIGPIFRCSGINQTGTFDHGKLGFVQLVEAGGAMLTIAFPPRAGAELANRFAAAGDMAEHQLAGSPGPDKEKAPPAPMVTDHQAVLSDDGDSIVLTVISGMVPLAVKLSKSRAAKVRQTLEELEAKIG